MLNNSFVAGTENYKKYVEIYSKCLGDETELKFRNELITQSKRIEELESDKVMLQNQIL